MKESGQKTIWKVVEFIYGLMAGNTKDNIKTIKSTDMVYIHGQMVVDMRETGSKGNSMD